MYVWKIAQTTQIDFEKLKAKKSESEAIEQRIKKMTYEALTKHEARSTASTWFFFFLAWQTHNVCKSQTDRPRILRVIGKFYGQIAASMSKSEATLKFNILECHTALRGGNTQSSITKILTFWSVGEAATKGRLHCHTRLLVRSRQVGVCSAWIEHCFHGLEPGHRYINAASSDHLNLPFEDWVT